MAAPAAKKPGKPDEAEAAQATEQKTAEEAAAAKKAEDEAAAKAGNGGSTEPPPVQEPPKPESSDEAPSGPSGEDAAEGQDVKYTVARLIADSYDLTGYPRHYAAGALHKHDAADELTASGAKSAIKKWLKGDIKDEDDDEGESA